MVIDTSIILAIYFNEPTATWAAEQLLRADRPLMSSVNLAECVIRMHSLQPNLADEYEQKLLASSIIFIPPDPAQAIVAARARLRYPINFGDCFAYALAKTQNVPLLTLDHDFRSADIALVLPPKP